MNVITAIASTVTWKSTAKRWGQEVGYRITWGLLMTLSLIPMWFLYRLSDALFLLVYHGFGYRKKVVRSNLERCFPKWEVDQIKKTERQFYQHFCDVLVETLKSFSLSDQQLTRRMRLTNPEILDAMVSHPQGCLLLASHYGNFEWMTGRMDLFFAQKIDTYGIYSPFSSPIFERLITYMRTQRGMKTVPMRRAMSQAIRHLRDPAVFGFIFDQSPHRGSQLYFSPFFGQATAFHTSVARLALRTGARVYYADIECIKRGKYSMTLRLLDATPFLPESTESMHAFTDLQVRVLEETIRRKPAHWLWSHRRWKLQKPTLAENQ